MELDIFFRIFRTVVYVIVAVESLFLGFLYRIGYKNYKTSNIIKSLQNLFFSLGIFFLSIGFVPLLTFYDKSNQLNIIITILLSINSLLIAQFLENFKKYTLEGVKTNDNIISKKS